MISAHKMINTKVIRPIDYVRIFSSELLNIKKNVSILDIGHGKGLHLNSVQFSPQVSIVAFDASSEWLSESANSKILGIAPQDLGIIPDASYDIVIAFDLIEHLSREDGYRLLYHMERIGRYRSFVYTPQGFKWQPPAKDNVFDAHISGWEFSDFKAFGYSRLRKGARLNFLLGPYSEPRFPILFSPILLRIKLLRFLNLLSEFFPRLSYSGLYEKKILSKANQLR